MKNLDNNNYQNFINQQSSLNNNNNLNALSMSQCTINFSNNEYQTSKVRKKILKSKIRRSFSYDFQAFKFNTYENCFLNSINQQPLTKNTLNENFLPICNVQIKNQFQQNNLNSNESLNINKTIHQRHPSIESSHSSSSINTIHEIEGAHYEWDDYKVNFFLIK